MLSKKTKKMIQKLRLSKKDFDDIREAVEKEEKNTSGEIALALIRESDNYSFWELFFALLLGAALFAFLIPLSPKIDNFLNAIFWIRASWQLPSFFGFTSFFFIALFFLFANIPALDRKIIPLSVQDFAVYQRALRHFVESGVYATENRSGILIFISVMERKVEIIADTGIAEKIEQEKWDSIAKNLSIAFKKNTVKDGLMQTIRDCGTLLTEHFPALDENPNELADGLVILEAGK